MAEATGGTWLERKALEALRELLRELRRSTDPDIDLRLWDGTVVPLRDRADGASPGATIAVRDPAAVARIVRRPSVVTLFEAVARGSIEIEGASPLAAARHWNHIEVVRFLKGIGAAGLARRLWPFLLLRSSGAGDLAFRGDGNAAEIRHHYDVSNAFYALFLDRRMVYSSAYFEADHRDLDEAQRAKLDHCCRKLRLRPGDRLLDIGCGWGALSIHAARHYGARAVGITLSEAQFEFARRRVAEAGLSDRVEIRLLHWRDLADEPFDAVAQIEMFEHIAPGDQGEFLATVQRHLRHGGVYLHQASVLNATFAKSRKGPYMKVIDRFVFPGGHLDSLGATVATLERARFDVHDVEALRRHFARTCALWTERLWDRREEAIAEVGPDVTRMWLLYLSMVTIGFERGVTTVHQTVSTRRGIAEPRVPLARTDIYEPTPPVGVREVA